MALKQGVIDGLDHTPAVCNLTKKFEDAKSFTQLTMPRAFHLDSARRVQDLPADPKKHLFRPFRYFAPISAADEGSEEEESPGQSRRRDLLTLPAGGYGHSEKNGRSGALQAERDQPALPATPINRRISEGSSGFYGYKQ